MNEAHEHHPAFCFCLAGQGKAVEFGQIHLATHQEGAAGAAGGRQGFRFPESAAFAVDPAFLDAEDRGGDLLNVRMAGETAVENGLIAHALEQAQLENPDQCFSAVA